MVFEPALTLCDKLEACRLPFIDGQDARWPSQAGSLTSGLCSEGCECEFVDAAGLIELYTRSFEDGASMGLRAARF